MGRRLNKMKEPALCRSGGKSVPDRGKPGAGRVAQVGEQ